MKVLVFILFIFLFNLSHQDEDEFKPQYSFNKTSKCVEVNLEKKCKYFYIWIDQKEGKSP